MNTSSKKVSRPAFTRRLFKPDEQRSPGLPLSYATGSSFLAILLGAVRTAILPQRRAIASLSNEEPALALDNAALCPCTFQILQPDGAFIPYGDFLHKASGKIQCFDRAAAEKMAKQFHGLVANAKRTLGNAPKLPFYVGHPDVPGVSHLYPDRGAKGWIEGVSVQADGALFQVKWNPVGQKLIENAEFIYYSPYWEVAPLKGNRVHPSKLISIGLTNNPVIPVPALANESSAPSEPESMKLSNTILAFLGLAADTEPDQAALENAITALHTKHTSADSALTLANTNLQAANTAKGVAESKVTMLTGELDAVRALANTAIGSLVDHGIAGLTASGHLVPADLVTERPRLLALANSKLEDFTTEVKRMAGLTPKIKITSITGGAAGAKHALANAEHQQQHALANAVAEEQEKLRKQGVPESKSYDLAWDNVRMNKPELFQNAA